MEIFFILVIIAIFFGGFVLFYGFLHILGIVGKGSVTDKLKEPFRVAISEHLEKATPENINSKKVGLIEDNLKPNIKTKTFNVICNKESEKALLINDDIWLPKSQIKTEWGEIIDSNQTEVILTIPIWLAEKKGMI